jgi:hypothetical protein
VHPAGVDLGLHAGDDEPLAQLIDEAVAELEHLGEVVAGVDVHDREGEPARAECLLGQAQQDQRVLAAAEQQHGPLELGGHFPHDEHGFGLEGVEVGQLVRADGTEGGGAAGGHEKESLRGPTAGRAKRVRPMHHR